MSPPDVAAGIDAADHAGSLVLASVAGLTDDQARAASRLPGWSRGHLLTHLARNADGVRGMVEGAIAGEEREQYPHGARGRAADIEAGADREPATLVADFETSDRRSSTHGTGCPTTRGPAPASWLAAGRQPMDYTLRSRRRELLVHWVDLGLGATPADLPDDFVEVERDWLLEHRTTDTWPDAPW